MNIIIPKKEKVDTNVSFSITSEMKRSLVKLANESNLTLSEFLREIFRQIVKKEI